MDDPQRGSHPLGDRLEPLRVVHTLRKVQILGMGVMLLGGALP